MPRSSLILVFKHRWHGSEKNNFGLYPFFLLE